ncbi:MAG: TolC family outer membrane protein [Pseudomonadota bacterium]
MSFNSLAGSLALAGAMTMAGMALPGTAEAATLAEIYELAVANDPQLASAKASYQARREVIGQARAGLLPNASATINTSYSDSTRSAGDVFGGFAAPATTTTGNTNSWSVQVTQPLFNMSRWFTFQQSRNIEAQAAANFAAEQQALIFRVSDSYLSILEAQDRLSAARAERDAVQRQLEQVQQRFDVGLVAITDVLESTAAFDSSTVNVIEAEGAQVVTFETLLRLTGQPYREVFGLSQEFPVEFPEPRDEEAWVKAALAGNFELAAAREAVESARRAIQVARSGHLPTVDARISHQDTTNNTLTVIAGGTPSGSADSEQTVAAISLNVPLFSGLSTMSAAKQRGFELEAAQRTFDLTQRTVVENTRNLYSAINTDVARVRARLRGIESSQSALDATQTGYEVGTRNIVDVLLAQQRLFAAQFQYASARYQYIRDTLRLKQVVGSLSPSDIYELNEFIAGSEAVDKITPTTR